MIMNTYCKIYLHISHKNLIFPFVNKNYILVVCHHTLENSMTSISSMKKFFQLNINILYTYFNRNTGFEKFSIECQLQLFGRLTVKWNLINYHSLNYCIKRCSRSLKQQLFCLLYNKKDSIKFLIIKNTLFKWLVDFKRLIGQWFPN